jgi:hypothetical protein
MKLVLHTFRKDARRLWPAIGLTLLLLSLFTVYDASRRVVWSGAVDDIAGVVLPLGWVCLLALAVLEEPQAGDRHFWLTRPHSRLSLLASKLLLAVAFVHLPLLLADSVTLGFRGFPPIAYLPHLGLRQLVLAAFVTLPAMGLAALVPGFTQFVLCVFGVATVIGVTGVGMVVAGSTPLDVWLGFSTKGGLLMVGVGTLIVVGGTAVLWMQYLPRRRRLAPAIGAATLLACLAAYSLVPETALARASARIHPGCGPVSLVAESGVRMGLDGMRGLGGSLDIDLKLRNLPSQLRSSFTDFTASIDGSDGAVLAEYSWRRTSKKLRHGEIRAVSGPGEDTIYRLTLTLDAAMWQRLNASPVRVRGVVSIAIMRREPLVSMRVGGMAPLPGGGVCRSALEANGPAGKPGIIVFCEVPGYLPETTGPSVVMCPSGTVASNWILLSQSDAAGYGDGLSPLARSVYWFSISSAADPFQVARREVPAVDLDNTRIEVRSETLMGTQIVPFDVPNLDLKDSRP